MSRRRARGVAAGSSDSPTTNSVGTRHIGQPRHTPGQSAQASSWQQTISRSDSVSCIQSQLGSSSPSPRATDLTTETHARSAQRASHRGPLGGVLDRPDHHQRRDPTGMTNGQLETDTRPVAMPQERAPVDPLGVQHVQHVVHIVARCDAPPGHGAGR